MESMESTETIRETRRLTRPRDGRWLGGVAAGLGAYFDLSPAIYRIAFAALSLAGGTGILLYLAAWAVIPEEGSEDSLAASALKRQRDRPTRAVGLAILAFVAILALSSANFWPSPGNLWLAAALGIAALVWWQMSGQQPARRDGMLLPVALGGMLAIIGGVAILDLTGVWNADWRIVLGAMVVLTGPLIGAGAATGRAVGAVVVLGFALLAALALALVVRVPLFAGVGDRVEHPSSLAALQHDYKLGIGDYTVNLVDVPVPAGETHVKATLGVGDLKVRVPYAVKVVVDAHAGAGEVIVFGHSVDGASADYSASVGGGHRVLVIDARVGLGQVEVTRR
jgi:phage shock protein PspC (stress-responsive transcriptional regulator)